ncbi:class E sortase [Frondihabitans australicus]|uniref:Sortase A n=1 Tax=Frondihabitans australicus TaxID=386892 RepID=A0A495IL11_9MICO|nr:class E sortase [Frondihabitans australicus]RKR75815.1 sortase A [Frondihabitans australicus]
MTDQLQHAGRRRAGRGTSVVGVLGEVLITMGVLVLMFIAWQQWFNDVVVSNQTSNQASSISRSLQQKATATPAPTATPGSSTNPAITPPVKGTGTFGVLYVPRFGSTYKVPIAGGTTTSGTLDKGYAGHYDDTQMPGQIGNFAVAGHRTTHGAPFGSIADLRVGDHIYVQTAQGWYTYTFRNLEYVKPTQVQVLQQVPDAPKLTAADSKDRLITMTSCNPKYSAAERIIAYGVFTSWQPLSAGPPAEIASEVKGA